jgi:hypothetical protein
MRRIRRDRRGARTASSGEERGRDESDPSDSRARHQGENSLSIQWG